jgi:hypothetical protein
MALERDSVYEGKISSGVDLKKVQVVKIYTIGKVTGMGSATVVEALDKDKKFLGSFLGGFLVSPCK